MANADWSLLIFVYMAATHENDTVRKAFYCALLSIAQIDVFYVVKYMINLSLPEWEGNMVRYCTLV